VRHRPPPIKSGEGNDTGKVNLMENALVIGHPAEAQGVPLQVGRDGLTGRRAQLQTELPQEAIQIVGIEFVDAENEPRPSGRPHDAFYLGYELVIL
jgi:hypothetical protein